MASKVLFWACNSSILSSKAVKTLAMAFCSWRGETDTNIFNYFSCKIFKTVPDAEWAKTLL